MIIISITIMMIIRGRQAAAMEGVLAAFRERFPGGTVPRTVLKEVLIKVCTSRSAEDIETLLGEACDGKLAAAESVDHGQFLEWLDSAGPGASTAAAPPAEPAAAPEPAEPKKKSRGAGALMRGLKTGEVGKIVDKMEEEEAAGEAAAA